MAIAQKPFTALVEDTMVEVRENSTETSVENKYKRRINDVYVRILPGKVNLDFMKTSSSVTISAAYSTGTVSGTAASANVTGVSTVWTTGMTGWKMKISGNDEVYTFTYASGTTGTVSPVLSETVASSTTYILFQDTYSMSADFEREDLIIPPGFFYDYGNSRVQLTPKFTGDWYRQWTTSSTNLPVNYRFFDRDSTNLYWQVQFSPPITSAKKISYEYVPALTEMVEYTTGTCATTAGDATITGTGTDFTNNVSAGDAFRMDSAPNDWYRISSVTDATHLELTANYPSSKTTAAYTISEIPKYPVSLQLSIFYGACALSCADQDNAAAVKNYLALMESVLLDYLKKQDRYKYGRQKMGVKDVYRG